jgi:malate dehydrogenase (oxaloacetate-decarboxylating)(NADP+)
MFVRYQIHIKTNTSSYSLDCQTKNTNRLIGVEQSENLTPEQRVFAREEDGGLPFLEVVQKYKPTMLLGMTGVGGLFKESIIKEMAQHCDRPVIFPLSNPTIKAECTATQAFEWTNGRCIFASGSPFDPVTVDGKIFHPTQCNNSKSPIFFVVI